jgi:hypothetical protein
MDGKKLYFILNRLALRSKDYEIIELVSKQSKYKICSALKDLLV